LPFGKIVPFIFFPAVFSHVSLSGERGPATGIVRKITGRVNLSDGGEWARILTSRSSRSNRSKRLERFEQLERFEPNSLT
jgi:hypothetical protein